MSTLFSANDMPPSTARLNNDLATLVETAISEDVDAATLIAILTGHAYAVCLETKTDPKRVFTMAALMAGSGNFVEGDFPGYTKYVRLDEE